MAKSAVFLSYSEFGYQNLVDLKRKIVCEKFCTLKLYPLDVLFYQTKKILRKLLLTSAFMSGTFDSGYTIF